MSAPWVTHRPNFVLFGDSITQYSFQDGNGWGARLADAYSRKADITCRGFSGYNTRLARYLLARVFPHKTSASEAPALVTVFFGANDASLANENPQQHVPLEEYKANLYAILSHVHGASHESTRIILITPPPICESQLLLRQQERQGPNATGIAERTNESAGIYAAACCEIGERTGIPVVNLWQVMQERGALMEGGYSQYLSDGLHLSPLGNELVFEEVLSCINTRYQLLSADNLPMHFPAWSTVNPLNPEAAFNPGIPLTANLNNTTRTSATGYPTSTSMTPPPTTYTAPLLHQNAEGNSTPTHMLLSSSTAAALSASIAQQQQQQYQQHPSGGGSPHSSTGVVSGASLAANASYQEALQRYTASMLSPQHRLPSQQSGTPSKDVYNSGAAAGGGLSTPIPEQRISNGSMQSTPNTTSNNSPGLTRTPTSSGGTPKPKSKKTIPAAARRSPSSTQNKKGSNTTANTTTGGRKISPTPTQRLTSPSGKSSTKKSRPTAAGTSNTTTGSAKRSSSNRTSTPPPRVESGRGTPPPTGRSTPPPAYYGAPAAGPKEEAVTVAYTNRGQLVVQHPTTLNAAGALAVAVQKYASQTAPLASPPPQPLQQQPQQQQQQWSPDAPGQFPTSTSMDDSNRQAMAMAALGRMSPPTSPTAGGGALPTRIPQRLPAAGSGYPGSGVLPIGTQEYPPHPGSILRGTSPTNMSDYSGRTTPTMMGGLGSPSSQRPASADRPPTVITPNLPPAPSHLAYLERPTSLDRDSAPTAPTTIIPNLPPAPSTSSANSTTAFTDAIRGGSIEDNNMHVFPGQQVIEATSGIEGYMAGLPPSTHDPSTPILSPSTATSETGGTRSPSVDPTIQQHLSFAPSGTSTGSTTSSTGPPVPRSTTPRKTSVTSGGTRRNNLSSAVTSPTNTRSGVHSSGRPHTAGTMPSRPAPSPGSRRTTPSKPRSPGPTGSSPAATQASPHVVTSAGSVSSQSSAASTPSPHSTPTPNSQQTTPPSDVNSCSFYKEFLKNISSST